MSVIQEPDNGYAAVTQLDGAVSETEQRRLEQQAESIVGSLATLDALGLALGHPARARRLPGHLVALTRPGGRVAVQEYDADGLPCFPTFEAFERMIEAGLMAIKHVGTDPHAGRPSARAALDRHK